MYQFFILILYLERVFCRSCPERLSFRSVHRRNLIVKLDSESKWISSNKGISSVVAKRDNESSIMDFVTTKGSFY